MAELNDKIKAALKNEDRQGDKNHDDADLFGPGEEMSMREMMMTTFRGKMRIWTYIIYIYIFLFLALAVFSGVQFFQSEAVKDLILYAGLFMLSLMIITAVKMWYWMLMNRNALTREIKRLEIQVARLAGMIESQKK